MFKKTFLIFLVVFALLTSVAHAKNDRKSKDDVVRGQYIVVLKDDVVDNDLVSDEIGRVHGLGVKHKYGHIMKGFSAEIPDERLQEVKDDPRVAFVSEDRYVYADGKPEATGRKGGAVQPPSSQIIPNGIKRISSNTSSNKGAGIGIAVIDTGIDLSHPDLKANIGGANKTCIAGTKNAKDDNGHGTHVAGTIAGINNTVGVVGVAPKAKLFAVKVLDSTGTGTWSSVICGVDWVTANSARYNIKVANMSLSGGGTSDNDCGNTDGDALHQAICRSVAKGVTYVVAAGNTSSDAENSVPSSYDDAVITVSALADSDGQAGGLGSATSYGDDDTFAIFSNYGSVVDIGAPGVDILSTWKGGTYLTLSGTSMASPHVAGAAALYIYSHPGSSWTQVRSALQSAGEDLGDGHTDPSDQHPEEVLYAGSL